MSWRYHGRIVVPPMAAERPTCTQFSQPIYSLNQPPKMSATNPPKAFPIPGTNNVKRVSLDFIFIVSSIPSVGKLLVGTFRIRIIVHVIKFCLMMKLSLFLCDDDLSVIGHIIQNSPGKILHQAYIRLTLGAKPLSEPMLGCCLLDHWEKNFSEMLIEIYISSFMEIHLKMSSENWRPFCLGLNELGVRISSK